MTPLSLWLSLRLILQRIVVPMGADFKVQIPAHRVKWKTENWLSQISSWWNEIYVCPNLLSTIYDFLHGIWLKSHFRVKTSWFMPASYVRVFRRYTDCHDHSLPLHQPSDAIVQKILPEIQQCLPQLLWELFWQQKLIFVPLLPLIVSNETFATVVHLHLSRQLMDHHYQTIKNCSLFDITEHFKIVYSMHGHIYKQGI